jgi:hypothetical protein
MNGSAYRRRHRQIASVSTVTPRIAAAVFASTSFEAVAVTMIASMQMVVGCPERFHFGGD